MCRLAIQRKKNDKIFGVAMIVAGLFMIMIMIWCPIILLFTQEISVPDRRFYIIVSPVLALAGVLETLGGIKLLTGKKIWPFG